MKIGEYRVLSFILDQTMWCGVCDREFSYLFMEHGDWLTGPEETRTCGIGLGKRQLIRHIVSLCQKGFISVDQAVIADTLLIGINVFGNPEAGIEPMPKCVIGAYISEARISGVVPRTAVVNHYPTD